MKPKKRIPLLLGIALGIEVLSYLVLAPGRVPSAILASSRGHGREYVVLPESIRRGISDAELEYIRFRFDKTNQSIDEPWRTTPRVML